MVTSSIPILLYPPRNVPIVASSYTHCSYDGHRAQPFFIRRVYTHGSVCQFGFQLGVGTADACGVSNHVAESVVQQGGKLFRTFIDLKKAYDKVDRQVLWLILARGGVPPRMGQWSELDLVATCPHRLSCNED